MIGCALARELAGARRRDRRSSSGAEPGAEASRRGGRPPRAPGGGPAAGTPLRSRAREPRPLPRPGRRSSRRETGIDVGYRRTGILRCDDSAAAPSASPDARWQREAGLPVEEAGRERDRRADPGGLVVAGRPRARSSFPTTASSTRAASSGRSPTPRGARRRAVRHGDGGRRFLVAGGALRAASTTDGGPSRGGLRRRRGGRVGGASIRRSRTCPSSPCADRSWSCARAARCRPSVLESEDVYLVPRTTGAPRRIDGRAGRFRKDGHGGRGRAADRGRAPARSRRSDAASSRAPGAGLRPGQRRRAADPGRLGPPGPLARRPVTSATGSSSRRSRGACCVADARSRRRRVARPALPRAPACRAARFQRPAGQSPQPMRRRPRPLTGSQPFPAALEFDQIPAGMFPADNGGIARDSPGIERCGTSFIRGSGSPADGLWQSDPRGRPTFPSERLPAEVGARRRCSSRRSARFPTVRLSARDRLALSRVRQRGPHEDPLRRGGLEGPRRREPGRDQGHHRRGRRQDPHEEGVSRRTDTSKT